MYENTKQTAFQHRVPWNLTKHYENLAVTNSSSSPINFNAFKTLPISKAYSVCVFVYGLAFSTGGKLALERSICLSDWTSRRDQLKPHCILFNSIDSTPPIKLDKLIEQTIRKRKAFILSLSRICVCLFFPFNHSTPLPQIYLSFFSSLTLSFSLSFLNSLFVCLFRVQILES